MPAQTWRWDDALRTETDNACSDVICMPRVLPTRQLARLRHLDRRFRSLDAPTSTKKKQKKKKKQKTGREEWLSAHQKVRWKPAKGDLVIRPQHRHPSRRATTSATIWLLRERQLDETVMVTAR